MGEKNELTLLRLPDDAKAYHESINWAVQYLQEMCVSKGIRMSEASTLLVENAGLSLRLTPPEEAVEGDTSAVSGAFSMHWTESETSKILDITGSDTQGVMYAILELADIIRYADDPLEALKQIKPHSDRPASPVRSVNRIFASEQEDKIWFHDRNFWDAYLTELATHRFNRFHLALGMGYDYGHDPGVQDNYFCFPYPYLITLPEYDVKVQGLPDGEVDRNFSTLLYIGQACRRRGIHFQLGLWTHAYDPSDSPNARYVITGLNAASHAAYCHHALRKLLQQCPYIDGVTIRTHYEGGIPEPAEAFWQEVFAGMAACGRRIELDLHAKGIDDVRMQAAREVGLPVVVSPKYWAEHMGLPYHQAAIRSMELPVERTDRDDLMSITATYRRFTRYGYADFLKEKRDYDVLFRLWPGTQRLLLWGDPAIAAGYGAMGTLGGSLGVELCEPLSFKGRKNSGSVGGREVYQDRTLQLNGEEWKKYEYSYRLWGRLLYNPQAEPASWRRYTKSRFGAAAEACEQALAHASRILPLITVAHMPSAANNVYWPEMYANMPIVAGGDPSPYDFDTPSPKTFGAVSPADPALFYGINEYVADLSNGSLSGKLSPLGVADRLQKLAEQAEVAIGQAYAKVRDAEDPVFRRWATDVEVQAGLGTFFAAKLRAGVAYALFEHNDDEQCLEAAIRSYHLAKEAWMHIVSVTRGVYKEDITFGVVSYMRGNWAARMTDIDTDLAAMELLRRGAIPLSTRQAVSQLLEGEAFDRYQLTHTPPAGFDAGTKVRLLAEVRASESDREPTVIVHYRHLNQVEAYRQTEAQRTESGFVAEIPDAYTDSPYPILYFFEVRDSHGAACYLPGFNETLSNQPYYLIHSSS
ncbi:hypothetical protein [Paenibacillus aestuarii]|uniref:Uncharacterized protein n=1 Tax=Paenibacillus aestuarii TaxID=516965 RepID=A0ABW0K749_9BACL|nr:hypothetical protein [Paenibacillus aestuarii]